MNHAVSGVERRLEPFSGGKINTGTPTRRDDRSAASLEPAYYLGAEHASASGHHNPHLVRIVVRVPPACAGGHHGGRQSRSGAERVPEVDQPRSQSRRTILRRPYLPTSLEPSDDPVRMGPSTLIGGYANEARYTLGAPDPATMLAIAGAPSDVLSGRPTITSETVTAYAKASLDLTMEGGTTSGVVYPLAVCELATSFRFRNVGGASAGAIAAALTAAAELGRSSQVLASAGSDLHGAEQRRDPQRPRMSNQIRPGFTGITDIISWLTQTRPATRRG